MGSAGSGGNADAKETSGETILNAPPTERFKDSLSLRARRHFQGTVDTDVAKKFNSVQVTNPGSGSSGGMGTPGSRKHSSPSRRSDSIANRGRPPPLSSPGLSVNLPPIEPSTPSLYSAKKTMLTGSKLLRSINPNGSPFSSPDKRKTAGISRMDSLDSEHSSGDTNPLNGGVFRSDSQDSRDDGKDPD